MPIRASALSLEYCGDQCVLHSAAGVRVVRVFWTLWSQWKFVTLWVLTVIFLDFFTSFFLPVEPEDPQKGEIFLKRTMRVVLVADCLTKPTFSTYLYQLAPFWSMLLFLWPMAAVLFVGHLRFAQKTGSLFTALPTTINKIIVLYTDRGRSLSAYSSRSMIEANAKYRTSNCHPAAALSSNLIVKLSMQALFSEHESYTSKQPASISINNAQFSS